MSTTGYRRCCGMDVHKKTVEVYVLPPDGSTKGEAKERKFRTFTRDLERLRLWLGQCKVTEVVMESTGQYWRPVWNVLEGCIEKLVLMNPQHVKGLRGRKTDKADAKWLAGHLARGELKGSFVPPQPVRELRDLTRQRVRLLQDLNRVKNRIGQLCETGNIKVSSVATNLFGVSGRRMLKGVVQGDREAAWMADWAQGTLRSKRSDLKLALEGRFSDHQRSLLDRMLKQVEHLEQDIAALQQETSKRVAGQAELIERLVTIPGVDQITAWTVLAEIGWDMSVFEDAKHLASWAALCPGSWESGGKRLSGRTRKGNPYLRRILCQAAWAASHKKGSYLQSMYHRLRGRRGHQKAIMALAHHLLVVIYCLLRDGGVYRELGEDYYDQQRKPEVTKRLVGRLNRMGWQVMLTPASPPAVGIGFESANSLVQNTVNPGSFS
jgi:transposase